MKRIYISGAISSLPRNEYMERFSNAETELVKHGYKVCNPTKLLPAKYLWIYKILGYNITLLYDIYHLMKCDGIYMIKGWTKSKGARLERAVAHIFNIELIKL